MLMVRPYRLGVAYPDFTLGPDMNPMPVRYLGPPVTRPPVDSPIQNYFPVVMQGGPGVISVPTVNGQVPVSNPANPGTLPQPGTTVVVSPTGGAIPPPHTPIVPAGAGGIMDWLQGSMFGGIPNWVLAGAAALLLFRGRKR